MKINSLTKEIDDLQLDEENFENDKILLHKEKELEKLLVQEELHWQQRAKNQWLKADDKHTTFFHQSAKARRSKNLIERLIDDQVMTRDTEAGIADCITTFYSNLYSSTSPTWEAINKASRFVEPRVDQNMNAFLNMEFSNEEIKKAAFEVSQSKAPGPDGFTASFYHHLWDHIEMEVCKAVGDVLNGGSNLDEWNETSVTVIPKIKKPEAVKDFRPISLCNVSYKILAKAITNRISKEMDKIIDYNQSAFVPRRLISDNILIAFECMHWLRNSKSKEGYAALKLDMSKAYDRIEWHFIEAMMSKLGFSPKWIDLILRCISSVSYTFTFNGSYTKRIYPTRGLRQGDPLSPYIFVICAQGLSSLINGFQTQCLIKGVRMAFRGPTISHLFFADDGIIFFKADASTCRNIRECLESYEKALGQVINFDKSALTFSPQTKTLNQERVKHFLQIRESRSRELYLGAPSFSLKNKRVQFGFLKERMLRKIDSWRHKYFSKGGNEVLTKAVLQTIPTFTMGCFRVPTSLLKELEMICARFWWEFSQEKGECTGNRGIVCANQRRNEGWDFANSVHSIRP